MDLFESDERELFRAEGGLEFFSVGENVFARVPFREAEIEDFATVEVGYAAGGGAESVEEPREFLEHVEFKNSQVAGRAQRPRLFDTRRSRGTRQGLASFAAQLGRFSSYGHLISIIGNERGPNSASGRKDGDVKSPLHKNEAEKT